MSCYLDGALFHGELGFREIAILSSAVVAALSAVMTVSARVPLRAAMALLLHVVAVASLYLTLDSQLLATIQLLVYAGAIVTLFVFVLMMVGPSELRGEGLRKKAFAGFAAGGIAVLVGGAIAYQLFALEGQRPMLDGCVGHGCGNYGGVNQVGTYLFQDAAVPFELVAVLLLVAVIGAMTVASAKPDWRAHPEFKNEVYPPAKAARAQQEAGQPGSGGTWSEGEAAP